MITSGKCWGYMRSAYQSAKSDLEKQKIIWDAYKMVLNQDNEDAYHSFTSMIERRARNDVSWNHRSVNTFDFAQNQTILLQRLTMQSEMPYCYYTLCHLPHPFHDDMNFNCRVVNDLVDGKMQYRNSARSIPKEHESWFLKFLEITSRQQHVLCSIPDEHVKFSQKELFELRMRCIHVLHITKS